MRNSALQFIRLNQIGHFVDLSPEIAFIVNGVKNGLINFLQLSQGKFFGQKFEYQRFMQ